MDRLTRSRTAVLFVLMALLLGVFTFRLLRLNTDAESGADSASRDLLTYRTTIPAARGAIYDRNGKELVVNRACYNVDVINFIFFTGSGANDKLLSLYRLFEDADQPVTDHLPVTMQVPYEYTTDDLSDIWRQHYATYLGWKGWDPEMTARNLLLRMRREYRIPDDWSEDDARKVLGVRYELDLRYCAGLDNYTMAADVPSDVLASVLEAKIPGVIVSTTSVREYRTKYAAHLLGRIGKMDAAEWEIYREKGYAMDAMVGKDGLERAFEDKLHGVSGVRYTTVTPDGAVVETYDETEPQAGSNVTLTIDIDLQKVAEDKLAEVVTDLRRNGVGKSQEGKDAEGGAVVAVSCKTGDVLACASYPTFDLTNYSRDFDRLKENKYSPLYNRALSATYNPGSIYKMVTAIAAVDYGGVGRYRKITDKGVYRYYEDQGYTCNCHIYTSSGVTHGTINMMEALSESCNYYFYEVGRETGIDAIDTVAKGLGLGEKTGVELEDHPGTRANPATKKTIYAGTNEADWYGADTLQAAIGQSDNFFTPLQMANYTATLANAGKRYQATFLRRVTSWDENELLYAHRPTVAGTMAISDEAMKTCVEGMRMAAQRGTAAAYLKDYPVAVCAKTGTAQHGSGGSDNASFVCFAPADDPEIAICVYVEKGAQGGNLGQVARAMLEQYFSGDDSLKPYAPENAIR
ncbi:MAG: hypothetical protein IJT18_05320 [Oscillospiraceae bacterium]|nr:hypothetical protein [Oscillospiraceae bacterium]